MDQAEINTDPPIVRCRMCGGRCRSDGAGFPRWIYCARCSWSSHDPRRAGWIWRLRVRGCPVSRQDQGAADGAIPTPPLPPCANCPHTAYVHLCVGGRRTSCSSWHRGRCGCKKYAPKEET